ncbi:MAG: thrombospondin type 3 repeat-containing protein [Solirubrobacteraceae bacterium]|jgi:large repetitive protein|nr:thrombospondin type 3 repeat-containing protein [Solirubrobacteraceae bacterium]MDP4673443.1 thrombospondin type 3 repeat-containing protein [Solirubrobacteraceae bacterium]
MSIKHFTAAVAAVGLIASLPASALAAKASKTDPDRDGLSTKVEKRLHTNAHRADTDRDGLKDGAEVRLGTNPLVKDSDKDGVSDGREVAAGTDPCSAKANQVRGAVESVGTDSVTITKADATTVTLTVNSATKLRIPDTDGSGTVTLADLKAGDKVGAHTSAADPTLALGIKVEAKGTKVAGTIASIGTDSVTITLADATTATVTVNSATKLRIPAADGTPTGTLADLKVGDAVKAKTVAGADNTTLALCLSAGVFASEEGPSAQENSSAQDDDRRGGRGRGGRGR